MTSKTIPYANVRIWHPLPRVRRRPFLSPSPLIADVLYGCPLSENCISSTWWLREWTFPLSGCVVVCTDTTHSNHYHLSNTFRRNPRTIHTIINCLLWPYFSLGPFTAFCKHFRQKNLADILTMRSHIPLLIKDILIRAFKTWFSSKYCHVALIL